MYIYIYIYIYKSMFNSDLFIIFLPAVYTDEAMLYTGIINYLYIRLLS